MRIHIQQWLKTVVCEPKFRKHIWWNDERKGLIAIHWKHASYEDYEDQDSILFKKWAVDNNRYVPTAKDSREERKRWKTNFRCALHSATNIRKGQATDRSKNDKSYRIYELLDTPDPDKVNNKKKSNKLAAKSKLKSDSEKRPYYSRLNRLKTEVKLEPDTYHTMCKQKNNKKSKRLANRRPKEEPMEVTSISAHTFGDSASPVEPADTYQHYNCCATTAESHSLGRDLPATLDDFNEDVGYYSASDSSSTSSSDAGSLSTEALGPVREELSSIHLDPVETILRRRSDEAYVYHDHDSSYYQCEIGADGIMYDIDMWGSGMVEEICASANVVTQRYTTEMVNGYSLTNL